MDSGTVRRELLHPIACEPCRQKKCKCDREIPVCSQCSGEPSKCSYPESGKRGLPLGYLTQLEQRLADTELALFEALATLSSIGHGEIALVQASAKPGNDNKQGKQARMEEWGRLPLRNGLTQDIKTWWHAKAENYITYQSTQGSTQDQHNSISVSYSPAPATNSIGNATQASPPASIVESIVSTGTSPNYSGNLHLSNEFRPLPPPETNFSRDVVQHTLPEVNTNYRSAMLRDADDSDLQTVDPEDGDKAAILASRKSDLYF